MDKEREAFIKENSKDGFLSFAAHNSAVKTFGATFRDIEEDALRLGIVPFRYKRNQSTISAESQKKLFDAHVAVIGCGGLGGNVAEMLARIGVGKLSLFDFDVFEEHNLNRQNFSTIESLGKEKVYVVKAALQKINPAVLISPFVKKFNPVEDFDMIADADVVVDALDNPQTKLELARKCKENEIGFVHGAIAGMTGQFTTNNTLENLYHEGGAGAESTAGNLPFTAAFAASVQSAEVVKIILGIGKTFKDEILIADLLNNEFILIPIVPVR
jgi:molybdopterin/thiamine biosynthesis adenylyltransferase